MHDNLPPAIGLLAHVKLSVIMGEIVNSVYGVSSSGFGYSQNISRVDTALEKLSTWHNNLPLQLQLEDDGTIPDRARIMLHMIHKQVSLPIWTIVESI
jgi:hypothetical protein